jgi:AcrR family transcriptional regulator
MPRRQPPSTARADSDGQTAPVPRARGRPQVITNERLLELAREVFLESGIRATTAEVAKRAGVSEGTVFHRFKSKDALFRAAMRFNPEELPAPVLALTATAGTGDLRANLLAFATRMLDVGRIALPVLMMSWSNPTGEYSLEKMSERGEGYRRAFRGIRGFFEAELRAGRLGDIDSELFARVFMGSLHHYCMSELFLVNQGGRQLSPAAFAEGLVDMLLSAVAAGSAPGERPRNPLQRL